MKISKQARREAKQLFQKCVVNGLLDEDLTRQAVLIVLKTKPRGYLGLLSHFQRLVKLALERRTARIESPAVLSPEMQAKVQAELVRAYGPGLKVAFGQNPKLIGGLRIRVGSDVFDGSVQARLAALQESF
jgi:F-type H+-transporting ATPase subunit delta